MNTPKMIGAVKRRLAGGFSQTKRRTSYTGYENAKVIKRLADEAIGRLSNKGGLRA
jgi:hypothetical protein